MSASIPHPASEWLETDGLGGYASGCADGTRTRRYHAALVAATRPPAGRAALVQGYEAWLVDGERRLPLSTQVYRDDVIYPDARPSLIAFRREPWPSWTFQPEPGLIVVHELFVPRGRSAVVLAWRLVTPRPGLRLEVRPFLSVRDPHALTRENPVFDFQAVAGGRGTRWRPYAGMPEVVAWSDGAYEADPQWYRAFLYAEERARGFDHHEDLASPGRFVFELSDGEAVLVLGAGEALDDVLPRRAPAQGKTATAKPSAAKPIAANSVRAKPALAAVQGWRESELERREACASPLERAAEHYLVRRGRGATIVAGYPWFGDWGRDTFIALRGLCLATGRLEEARSILLEWARHVSEGMLPNRFPDAGEAPEYNSVDAGLWFVIAVHELRAAARAQRLLSLADERALLAAVVAILDGYAAGTRHGIALARDGLLFAGEPGVQLTWMDAKVGDHVVTPRIGKPVEIQALWLNALWTASRHRPVYRRLFDKGLDSFQKRFWNAEQGALFDVVDEDHVGARVDASLRPNQLLAVGGLPLVLLEREQARSVVDVVEARLWTPFGPRTLDPLDARYVGRYAGDAAARDNAYHQGTAWPWLAGPFIEAWVRVRGCTNAARAEARERFLEPLLARAAEAGPGHVPEIADGDAPFAPRGCPFQAWSVGEALRLSLSVLEPVSIDGAACDTAACAESGCKRPRVRRT